MLRPSVKVGCTSRRVSKVYKDPGLICKNCKHYNVRYEVCTHPVSTTVDLVTGSMYFDSAEEMRDNPKKCGMNAKYFDKENDGIVMWKEMTSRLELESFPYVFAQFTTIFVLSLAVWCLAKLFFTTMIKMGIL